MKKLFLLILLVITGCNTNAVKIIGPSGNEAYSIDCGAHVQNCLKKAGELCPHGYIDISSTSEPVLVGNVLASKNHMAIECKP